MQYMVQAERRTNLTTYNYNYTRRVLSVNGIVSIIELQLYINISTWFQTQKKTQNLDIAGN